MKFPEGKDHILGFHMPTWITAHLEGAQCLCVIDFGGGKQGYYMC